MPWLLQASDGDGRVLDCVPVEAVTVDDGTVRMTGRGERFAVATTWTVLDEAGSWSVEADVADDGAPDAPDASVAVAIQVPADRPPDWLIPALFYGENRPAESRAAYPRWVPTRDGDAGGPVDPFASSEWWFRSDRAAIPAVLASGGGLRVALATTERSPAGQTGTGFGPVAGPDGDRWEIRLAFPYREAPIVYDGSPDPLPPDRPTIRWPRGTSVRLAFRVDARPFTHDATTAILRPLHAWLAAEAPLNPWVDAATAADLAAEGLLRWHHRPADAVLIETAAFERGPDVTAPVPGDRAAMHVAWLSGVPTAAALLNHGRRTGNDAAIRSATDVLDNIAGHLAPCGTFWGQWTAGAGWTKGWTPGPDALLARTLGEATLFLARAALTTGHPGWRAAVESNVRYVLGRQRDDGAVPSAWNGRTGDTLSWAGTAGLAWVPALLEASRLLGEATFGEAARRLGRYHAADVEAGFLFGAPEDVDLGPTSEDGYVAVMAYVALAETAKEDGDDATAWIELARRAADWTLTFRYAYNVDWRADSLLSRLDVRSRGADLASPANQHLHTYGLICTGELAALSRLTGDAHYLERAREMFAFARQLIARHDGDFGARRAMAPERIYQTRYDGEKGGIGPLSHAWCLGLLLHAAELAIADPELAIDG